MSKEEQNIFLTKNHAITNTPFYRLPPGMMSSLLFKSTMSFMYAALFSYRRYIWNNAWNELRYRYAGTIIGIFWNVVHPLVMILLYTVIFSWIFPQRGRGEYAFYLTSGLLAWRAFSETIQRGSNAFIEHARYLKRLPIPAEVFLAQQTLTATLMLFLHYLLLLAFMVGSGETIGMTILCLPVILIALQVVAFGVSVILANLRALFPDVEQIVHALLPLWMWTLPVVYPETVIPPPLRAWLWLNPPFSFLRSIRQILLNQQLPPFEEWFAMALWLCLAFGTGAVINRTLQHDAKEAL